MPDMGRANESGGGRRGSGRVIVVLLVAVLAGAALLVYTLTRRPSTGSLAGTRPASAPSSTQPQTAPTTQAAAKAPSKPAPPSTQYIDVVRANYPKMPQTQPMATLLDLPQAARLLLKEPVYLSTRGDLWITRPDAPPTETALTRAVKEQADQLALAVREVVAFVHWMPRDTGPWTFDLIARRADGGYEVVTQSGRKPIESPGRTYHWERALDWNDKVIVATDTGVSVFQFEPELRELHQELAPKPEGGAAPANLAEPQFLLDWQGVLAWLPWERGKTGSRGAARFVEGKWSSLGPEQGWPEKLLHLVPLFDGSVLQIVAKDADQVQVALVSLEQLKVDEAEVTKQVEALSDADDNVRQKAYKELTRYGPALAPIMEKLVKDQDPQTQALLRQLIKTQVEPTLGGMTLLGDQLRVAARLADGGAVFYAEAGVMIPGEGDNPILRTPAWLSIRPGQAVTLLDPPLTTDLNPDRSRIYVFDAEWIVTNDARGPQRFVGNGFVPLLRKSEVARGFIEPLGIDRRGRWLFRRPARPDQLTAGPSAPARPAPGPVPAPPQPATAPAPPATGPAPTGPLSNAVGGATRPVTGPAVIATGGADGNAPGGAASENGDDAGATLIVDPTLPDPTPRLPVWLYTTAEAVGWDKDGWPVVKRGGAWALTETKWRPFRPKEKMLTKPDEVPAAAAGAAEAAVAPGEPHPAAGEVKPRGADKPPDAAPPVAKAAGPEAPALGKTSTPVAAPAPTTTSAADDLGPPLLVDADGNRYYDGNTHLRVGPRDGKRVDWPLPPAATGGGIAGKIYLVRAKDGLLFLFNQPGRVVRIRPTPDADEPFTVDATFTRNIPTSEAVTRIWLDPAGRMIMAYETKLAIMFPAGFIPPEMTRLIGDTEVEEP